MIKKTKQKEVTKAPAKQKHKDYTLRVGKHLYKRIDQHMSLLKYLNNKIIKQKWLQEAIKEKFEVKESPDDEIGDKFLHLKLDMDIWNKLGKKVDYLKPFHSSMSKKIIIEEAILEKLEREESKTRDLLKKKMKETLED